MEHTDIFLDKEYVAKVNLRLWHVSTVAKQRVVRHERKGPKVEYLYDVLLIEALKMAGPDQPGDLRTISSGKFVARYEDYDEQQRKQAEERARVQAELEAMRDMLAGALGAMGLPPLDGSVELYYYASNEAELTVRLDQNALRTLLRREREDAAV